MARCMQSNTTSYLDEKFDMVKWPGKLELYPEKKCTVQKCRFNNCLYLSVHEEIIDVVGWLRKSNAFS